MNRYVAVCALLLPLALCHPGHSNKKEYGRSDCVAATACFNIGCNMCNTPYMYECCPEYCTQLCSNYKQYEPAEDESMGHWGNGEVPEQKAGPTPPPDLGALLAQRIDLNYKPQPERSYLPGEEPTDLRPANATETRGSGEAAAESEQEEEEGDGECPRPPDYEPCISADEASERVQRCCEAPDSGIDKGCGKYCRENKISTSKFIQMRNDESCDLERSGRPFMECFSEGNDVTDCCKAKGVPSYCRPMCNPSGNWPPMDIGLFQNCKPLDTTLDKIAHCYHAYQN